MERRQRERDGCSDRGRRWRRAGPAKWSSVRFGALVGLVSFLSSVAYAQADTTPWFKPGTGWVLVGVLVLSWLVALGIWMAKQGESVTARQIEGLEVAEDSIGRAVEMGRPIVFVPGTQSITSAATIAGLSVLRLVAEKCAEMGARLIVPCRDTIVTSIAQETVEAAYREAGRHDLYRAEDVFFITRRLFAYVAGVNGVIEREHPATVFLQGEFSAESLIFGETAHRAEALIIAGTDKETQLPFFVTTCDYTLIGEELYAAGATISRDAPMLGSLRGIDLGRWIIGAVILVGVLMELAGVAPIRRILGG